MSVVELAADHVEKHLKREFRRAFLKVEKERHGKGCGCPACKKSAVEDINSISNFLAGGEPIPQYQIDKDGDIDLR